MYVESGKRNGPKRATAADVIGKHTDEALTSKADIEANVANVKLFRRTL